MVASIPQQRQGFGILREMSTRWIDNDAFGHMNNAVHFQFFDTIVNRTLADLGTDQLPDDPTRFVVVETGCRYLAEIRYPDRVTLGLRVAHLGRSSVRYDLAMFREDEDQAAAVGYLIHVNTSRATGRPLAIPEGLHAALAVLHGDPKP
ncbi:acyl-CoA thioesterase [Phaeovulum sp.]|uniref:acyl-CoA thioesterase n=1 Tax=Phaeovulum sp. TaxID=2934796 RepID=UPI0039E48C53